MGARWIAALRDMPHAFGHTWESCHAFALSSGLPTHLYSYASDKARVVVPVAERQHEGAVDVVTPYGASGFAAVGEDPDFPARWQAFAAARIQQPAKLDVGGCAVPRHARRLPGRHGEEFEDLR